MGEMSLDSGREEREHVASLLAARFDHGQHSLHELAAAGALGPERELSPDHRMAQRSFARIVRRFHPLVRRNIDSHWRCLYIFARSQVMTPPNPSPKKAVNAVASRVARTANTVNISATNVHSQALPLASLVPVSSIYWLRSTR